MSGKFTLIIDGSSVNQPGKTYGQFEYVAEVKPGVTNVLPFTIWMPVLDMGHAVTIPSPTTQETVITTPRIPGLELHIPPGTVLKDLRGNVVRQVSITAIPVDRPPFPLPNVPVPIYFTIQPGGASMGAWSAGGGSGMRLIYPNPYNNPPGTGFEFWNYEPDATSAKAGWYVYGEGKVAPDRKQVVPNPGVFIYEFTGAMIGSGGSPPGSAPPPGGGSSGGDPVDLSSGLLVIKKTDLYLADVLPLAVTRTYRPIDPTSRAFGVGTNFSYGMFLWSVNNYQQADLVLADGGRIHYVRISPGTGWTDAIYEHTATPTIFYGSKMTWNNSNSGWDITLKNETVYHFPEFGPLTYFRDRYGNQVSLTWSGGNLAEVVSPNGRTISFTYDASNRITQAQDNIGRSVHYTYDSGGRLWTVTDLNGGVTTYTYDTSGDMLTLKDARGITFLTNQYDANARVIKQTLADGSIYQFGYTLGGSGNVTQTAVTDPRGIVEQVTYNANGYTLTDTYAVGKPEQQQVTYAPDATSNLVQSVTDALGRQTAYTYDSMGNVLSVTRLAGTSNAVTTSIAYDPTFNQVTSVTDPLSHSATFSYDSRGNLSSITDPLGKQTTMAYNYAGQPTSVTDPLSHVTQLGYDDGDLVGVTDPLNRTSSRFVDAAGRLVSVTDPLGKVGVYTYDPLNELTLVKDPQGNATSFAYDPNGNLLSVTDANNHPTVYTYDNMDRLATRKDALLNSESYLHDANGNLTQFTDRRGKVTAFTYDNLNRRTFAGFGKAGSHNFTYESTITYTYDAGNRLTQVVDSLAGTIVLGYDGLNRLTSQTTPQGTVSYAYDAAGRRTTMTVAGQPLVGYTYDVDSRLTQIAQGSSSVGFTYDNAGRRTSLTLPNGVAVNYGFDVGSQLTGLTYMLGTNTLGNLTYGYDADGREVGTSGSFARTGLPTAVSSATYNANNQLTHWGTASPTYDLNGNLTNDGLNTYAWDARNQLTSIASGRTTIGSFTYDAFGRRKGKTVAGTTTGFLYDGVNSVQELSGTTPTANLLTGGLDEFFMRTDSAGARNYLADALGSTVALADSSGTVQTQYTYQPFGATTATGGGSNNTLEYTGRENDGTGLYYYRARYYSPSFQRFVSEDPMGFGGGGPDLYPYALNSPPNFDDPLGMQAGGGSAGCAPAGGGRKGSGPAGGGMMPCVPGGTGNEVGPPQTQTQQQKKQACLNEFNNSPDGKFYNFWSLGSPFIGPNKLESTVEDTAGIASKYAGYKGLKYVADNDIALPELSPFLADGIPWVAKEVVLPVSLASTVGQVTGHVGCSIASFF